MFSKFISIFVKPSGNDSYLLTGAGYALIIALIVVLLLILTLFRKEGKKIKTSQLVFASTAIALATVSSCIKLFEMPQGGSVTFFSMIFICLIGYLYGPRIGLITSVAYGLLQFIIDPFIIKPAQPLFDYILAFGMLGLSGFFWKSRHGLIKGYLAGVTGRLICHLISGYLYYTDYAGGMGAITYTFTYNLGYILPEAIATLLILSLSPVRHALFQVKKMAEEH